MCHDRSARTGCLWIIYWLQKADQVQHVAPTIVHVVEQQEKRPSMYGSCCSWFEHVTSIRDNIVTLGNMAYTLSL